MRFVFILILISSVCACVCRCMNNPDLRYNTTLFLEMDGRLLPEEVEVIGSVIQRCGYNKLEFMLGDGDIYDYLECDCGYSWSFVRSLFAQMIDRLEAFCIANSIDALENVIEDDVFSEIFLLKYTVSEEDFFDFFNQLVSRGNARTPIELVLANIVNYSGPDSSNICDMISVYSSICKDLRTKLDH